MLRISAPEASLLKLWKIILPPLYCSIASEDRNNSVIYEIKHINIKTEMSLLIEYENTKRKQTWRERVEREVGGGIGMGKTCKLKAVSFQCMTKFTTN